MLNLERNLTKKRGFIGYSPKEVKEKIQALQDQHQKELSILQNQLIEEKEKNQELKAKLNEIKEQPIKSSVAEELTSTLKEHFFRQTKAILELKVELEERESILKEKLEGKIMQREFAQKLIQDTLQYLNNQKTELQKELIK